MCLVTRQEDPQWSDFVNWMSLSLVYAEMHGINQVTSNEMPIVTLFGPSLNRVFRDTIHSVGNYGEVYEKDLSAILPRSGRNLLEETEPTTYLPPWFSP